MSESFHDMLRPVSTELDWPEDLRLENGNYANRCIKCGEFFMGHKRRFVCRVCQENLDGLIMAVYNGDVKCEPPTTKDENGQATPE